MTSSKAYLLIRFAEDHIKLHFALNYSKIFSKLYDFLYLDWKDNLGLRSDFGAILTKYRYFSKTS